ncbi:hypothetical protein KSP39_PZI018593 [Platanthera zijinensis]|uniref:Uncharacterized protein n=1 Tax=Platanthera zijinensis TaxID=2320716 RepID=A0AAP0FZB9_9ASPA
MMNVCHSQDLLQEFMARIQRAHYETFVINLASAYEAANIDEFIGGKSHPDASNPYVHKQGKRECLELASHMKKFLKERFPGIVNLMDLVRKDSATQNLSDDSNKLWECIDNKVEPRDREARTIRHSKRCYPKHLKALNPKKTQRQPFIVAVADTETVLRNEVHVAYAVDLATHGVKYTFIRTTNEEPLAIRVSCLSGKEAAISSKGFLHTAHPPLLVRSGKEYQTIRTMLSGKTCRPSRMKGERLHHY